MGVSEPWGVANDSSPVESPCSALASLGQGEVKVARLKQARYLAAAGLLGKAARLYRDEAGRVEACGNFTASAAIRLELCFWALRERQLGLAQRELGHLLANGPTRSQPEVHLAAAALAALQGETAEGWRQLRRCKHLDRRWQAAVWLIEASLHLQGNRLDRALVVGLQSLDKALDGGNEWLVVTAGMTVAKAMVALDMHRGAAMLAETLRPYALRLALTEELHALSGLISRHKERDHAGEP